MGNIVVDRAKIQAIVRDANGQVIDRFRTFVRCVEARAKQKAKVDTGVLRASITSEVTQSGSEIRGEIRADAPYAGYVESGTGVHGENRRPIRPKHGKYLVFKGRDGATVFAKQVEGQPPAPFMAPSVDECLSEMTGR